MQNRKTWLILGTLVVAGVIGFVALRGGYPPRTNVEGAIGGADRYQSTQISDADVVLKDAEVQAFLQSDLFHKLSTDDNFRRIVRKHHEAFSEVAANEAFSELAATEFSKISVTEDYRALTRRKGFLEFAKDGGLMEFASNKDAGALMEELRKRKVSTVEALNEVLSGGAFEGIREAVESAHFPMVASAVEFQRLWETEGFVEIARLENLKELLAEGAYADIANLDEFVHLLGSTEFVEAMQTEALRKVAKARLLENYVAMPE